MFSEKWNSLSWFSETIHSNIIQRHSSITFQNFYLILKETREKWLNIFIYNYSFIHLISEVCNLILGEFSFNWGMLVFYVTFIIRKISNRCFKTDFPDNIFRLLYFKLIITAYLLFITLQKIIHFDSGNN